MKKADDVLILTTITTMNVANQSLFNNNKIVNIITIILCFGLLLKMIWRKK